MGDDWTAVIPVKRLGTAKTRLRGAVPDDRHEDLALAMVHDTVAAVLACPAVTALVVVTDDPAAADTAAALGAHPVPDRPGAGLNAALRFGADTVAGTGVRRAALTGDLPALRPEQLGSVLRLAERRSFVPDAEGTGTVLLAAPAGVPLDPHFGPGSAVAHAASGAAVLTGDWPGLRQDVDTASDLDTVLAFGVGDRTRALLREICRPADFGCGAPAR